MKRTLICLVIAFLSVCVVSAQEYKIVQVTLKNGLVVKGKKGVVTNESISLLSGSAQKTYPLSEVNLIQAKEGKAGKWALGMGGGCAAICIVVIVANGSQNTTDTGVTYSTGQLVAGSIIWTGLFAAAGALIGNGTDHWNNVYIAKAASRLKNFDINFGPNRYAKYNFTLAYKF